MTSESKEPSVAEESLPTTKYELELLKLQAEYIDLNKPWYVRSLSWGTIISIVSLFFLWYSGVVDNQAILNEIKEQRQQERMEKNEATLVQKNLELTTAKSELKDVLGQLKVAKQLREALTALAEMDGKVEVSLQNDEPKYRVELPAFLTQPAIFISAAQFGDTEFNEKLIDHFAAIPNLVELELDLRNVNDDQMIKLLNSCANVEVLKLIHRENDLTGRITEALSGFDNLWYLTVQGVQFSPEHLKQLTQIKRLSSLSLQECGITAETLPIFNTIEGLGELDVSNNSISVAEGEAFAASNPDLSIAVEADHLGVPQLLGRDELQDTAPPPPPRED